MYLFVLSIQRLGVLVLRFSSRSASADFDGRLAAAWGAAHRAAGCGTVTVLSGFNLAQW